ncbi:exopolysaccharide biosynthesis protein [Vannielia litorea]|uniref:exopolysaccharide biosynthesis protein n=1 Tax=Vannielia litorea TaxID=1217970 RepID=UPI001BCAFC7B|nr:exopolysaccharide biosynthesis protein [Vannielia litorea]MBS8227023.1 exopolysaccharide biosynthesis protein [Vannielia litorea]
MADRRIPEGRRPSLSLPILRASRTHHALGTLTLGELLASLGERSFGWSIVVFSLLTLLPLPPPMTLITALPVMLATAQMALGYPHVRLPRRIARMRLDHEKLRRTLLRLRPVTRRLERVLFPRYQRIFARRYERPLGLLLFIIAFALFLPVPLSGWFPAISLFIVGVGLTEQDGLVVGAGLVLGVLSVVLTASIITAAAMSAERLMEAMHEPPPAPAAAALP